jgi:GTP-binding protein Era
MTRSGNVAVVGKPNAGKSTLLNRIVGQKLSIISEKPQSTRDRVVGIYTADGVQMVISDTPGLLNPRYALHQAMRGAALEALRDADCIVYLADATDGVPPPLEEAAGLSDPPPAPVLTVLNKIDALREGDRETLRQLAPEAIPISALRGDGVDHLLGEIVRHLPESPFLYPEDELATRSMRFFVSELVRETALEQLDEEVPYSVACAIEEFREDRTPVYIRAVIYVERESQKGILIGEKGARIREIGRAARAKIEQFVDAAVYLDLWVKVLPNWRRDPRALRRFGYRIPEEQGR